MKNKKAVLALGSISFLSVLLISGVLTLCLNKEEKPRLLYNQTLMDQGFSSFEKNGYKYTIKSTKTGFTINADPIIPGKTGNRHFYADKSGVIRWSTKGRATRESPVLEDCH